MILKIASFFLLFAFSPLSGDRVVEDVHAASTQLREAKLRQTIAKNSVWPGGTWGDNLWTLAALRLNEKTEQANARLLERAERYLDTFRTTGGLAMPIPEEQDGAPWTFFSITDYVRTLALFRLESPYFPGRLNPETEAAMKEALWLWTSKTSRLADYGADDLFLLLGTENHDLNRRPVHHLVTAILENDPRYRDRKLADGHTTAEHAVAHTAFFRAWPSQRAASGMWIEVGSNSYQKYSWPALLNLHELSPDPMVRHRFGLLLDLVLIEEAQISVKGRRGGGRSRASHKANGFESIKSLLYGEGGGSSHSRVLETSGYQAPAEAIILRKMTFPAEAPFVIRNRVLGRIDPNVSEEHRIMRDSSLVNYAYRTPRYLLGSTLQNPALESTGISKQNRTCGMLFDNPSQAEISQIYPWYEHVGKGRPQHSIWSVQHEGVLLVQRIARVGKGQPGSYNTGKLGVKFEGSDLKKLEEGGWIFASDGKAYAAVKFLDHSYFWDDTKTLAFPDNDQGSRDTARIVIHTGDLASHRSWENFRESILAHPLEVTAEKVDYRFGAERIEVVRYDARRPQSFTLPVINGQTIDLNPKAVYESPFLKGSFGGEKFMVEVGNHRRMIDFASPAK